MESLVVLGFLLIPLANGVAFALPILVIAFALNAALLKYKVATLCVHLSTIALFIWNFNKEIEGELGRNSAFMVAHIIGVIICFFLYIIILKIVQKNQ